MASAIAWSNPARTSNVRIRIVIAFATFATLVGAAVAAVGWFAVAKVPPPASLFGLPIEFAALWGGGVIALTGTLLGSYTASRVLAPVEEIGSLIDLCPPDELADELASRRYSKDIGVLASQVEESMRRVQSFVEREQRFSRYASHELRSPVAVIRGATELLQANPATQTPSLRRPLERIERSVADMESIIEAFLWLARERSDYEMVDACLVLPVVRETLRRYEYLIENKPVTVRFIESGNPSVEAPPAAISMVIGNLIANAFHYTDEGEVTVEVGSHHVVVTDQGGGLESDIDSCCESFVRGEKSVGYGLGLAIVHSLTDRFGWWLEIESEPGTGMTATLRF